MFFLLCILSAFGYAMQSSLMVSYYRRLDPLSAISYRSLSLGITMFPLLLFTQRSDLALLPNCWKPLLVAGLLTAVGYWSRVKAYRCLPVGIAVALCVGIAALILIGVGVVVFGEVLTHLELILAVTLVIAIVLIGLSKSKGTLPMDYNPLAGLLYSLLSATLVACSLALLASVSRQIHPFIAAYGWEIFIGASGLSIAITREFIFGHKVARITWADAKGIFVFTSPAVVGAGCFTYAISIGSLAIASAIATTNVAMSALIAYVLYKELPTNWQWLLIFLVIVLLAALQLAKII